VIHKIKPKYGKEEDEIREDNFWTFVNGYKAYKKNSKYARFRYLLSICLILVSLVTVVCNSPDNQLLFCRYSTNHF